MKYIDKQILFKNFLTKWGTKFSKLPHLAQLFTSFPSFQQKLEQIPIINSHELNEYQLEWISLVAQFDNPIDKEFFKPCWVPVSKNEYEYFVDLSSKAFAVFKINYLGSQLQQWSIEEIIPDISEFILALDNKTISFDEILYDDNGNLLDENGNSILDFSPPSYIDHHELHETFEGYDLASITDDNVVIYGHFLESPIEDRLIEMFKYIPVADNSTKPYQADWMIYENKLLLSYVNATINGKELTSYEIVPEDPHADEEPLFQFTYCSDVLTFIVEGITNPGYSSSIYNVGDTLSLSFSAGILTSCIRKSNVKC